MNPTIIQSIQERKLLSLTYEGLLRTVEPHAYGISTQGNEILRCYQIEGSHNSDIPHDWVLLAVSKILDLTLLQTSFSGPRPKYNRDDKAMTTIYAQL